MTKQSKWFAQGIYARAGRACSLLRYEREERINEADALESLGVDLEILDILEEEISRLATEIQAHSIACGVLGQLGYTGWEKVENSRGSI